MEEAIQSSVYVATPDFAGWLQKRGFAWRKLWKKRWIAINGAEIAYMDKEPTPENLKSVNVSKSQITSTTIVRADDDPENNELGFSIHLNDGQQQTWYLRAETVREKKNWVIRLGYVIAIVKWLESFDKLKVLGVGGSGIVYEVLHKSNGKRFAMKEIEIKTQKMREMAISEAEMLKDIMENITHPNILHIEKVFQVGSKFYLVFPLCTGGELYEHIVRRGHFDERDAAKILRDLVSALDALHSREILHLDIKPENILFDSDSPDAQIKLTDFGISRVITSGDERVKAKNANAQDFSLQVFNRKTLELEVTGYLDIGKVKGTVGYMSPELILMNYPSKAADIFASGVILYILLFGRPPFGGQSDRAVLEKTACGKAVYRQTSRWESVSAEARDLVDKMLCHDPLSRISAEDVLRHPWITKNAVQPADSSVDKVSETLGALSVDKQQSMQATLKLLSKHVSQQRTKKMATNFTQMMSMLPGSQKRGLAPIADGAKPGAQGAQSGDNEDASPMMPFFTTLAESYLKPTVVRGLRPSVFAKEEVLSQEELSEACQGITKDEEVLAVLNADLRDALSRVLVRLRKKDSNKMRMSQFESEDASPASDSVDEFDEPTDESDGMPIELFLSLMRFLQDAPDNPSTGPLSGVAHTGALHFARFMDRDGDGKISLSDFIDSQAEMLQRSEIFLKLVFRIYVESMWYPGRQLNAMQLVKQTLKSSSPEDDSSLSPSVSSSSIVHAKDTTSLTDVVQPPKVITVRHITNVFQKLGYDIDLGAQLFDILCEKAKKLRRGEVRALTGSVPLPSSIPRVGGLDREASQSSMYDSLESSSITTEQRSTEALTNAIEAKPVESDAAERPSDYGEEDEQPPAEAMNGQPQTQKLDLDDFIRLCRVEDVLIQALFQRSRQTLALIVKRANKLAEERADGHPPSYYIERELIQAVNIIESSQAAAPSRPGARIAAVGRVALTAAFDFASKVAQSLSQPDVPTEEYDSDNHEEFHDCVADQSFSVRHSS